MLNEKTIKAREKRAFINFSSICLLTKTEGLDDGTVTIDIVHVQVLQQLTTLTNEHGQ